MNKNEINGQNSAATSANEKKFNGFNSQEQYDAVMNALDEFAYIYDVTFDEESYIIYVEGEGFSLSIAGDFLLDIHLDDARYFDDVLNIDQNTYDIWEAFEKYQPKEEEVNA